VFEDSFLQSAAPFTPDFMLDLVNVAGNNYNTPKYKRNQILFSESWRIGPGHVRVNLL